MVTFKSTKIQVNTKKGQKKENNKRTWRSNSLAATTSLEFSFFKASSSFCTRSNSRCCTSSSRYIASQRHVKIDSTRFLRKRLEPRGLLPIYLGEWKLTSYAAPSCRYSSGNPMDASGNCPRLLGATGAFFAAESTTSANGDCVSTMS